MVKEKYVDVKNNYKQDSFGRDTTQHHLYQHNIFIENNNTTSNQYKHIAFVLLSDIESELNTINKLIPILSGKYLACSGGQSDVGDKTLRVGFNDEAYFVETIYDLEEIFEGSDSDSVVHDYVVKVF